MPSYRPLRVAEMIHRELAQRLREDIKDPRIGMVSITHVEVTRDLRVATVSYLPLGGGEADAALDDAMKDAARHLRGPIGRALRLRYSPELRMVRDVHTDQAVRLTNLLTDLVPKEDEPEAAPEDVSSEQEEA